MLNFALISLKLFFAHDEMCAAPSRDAQMELHSTDWPVVGYLLKTKHLANGCVIIKRDDMVGGMNVSTFLQLCILSLKCKNMFGECCWKALWGCNDCWTECFVYIYCIVMVDLLSTWIYLNFTNSLETFQTAFWNEKYKIRRRLFNSWRKRSIQK